MRPSRVAAILFLLVGGTVSTQALPLIPADCQGFPGDVEACQLVLDENNLSLGEKKELFAELWIGNDLLPNHAAILEWDDNILVGSPPSGTLPQSNLVIKNAWIRFLYVLPAVYDKTDGQWLLPKNMTAKLRYNYGVVAPFGTEPGDCLTNYSVADEDSSLRVTRNGSYLGSSLNPSIQTVPGTNTLAAELQVVASILVLHYDYQTVCTAHDPVTGACTQTAQVCQQSSSEVRDYYLTVSDSFTGIRQDFDYALQFRYEDLNGLRQAHLEWSTTAPMNELLLDLDGATYSLSEAAYGVKRRLSPYDFLYLERTRKESRKKSGLVELAYERRLSSGVYAYNLTLGLDQKPEQCALRLLSDFNEFNESSQCVFLDLNATALTLALDKADYDFQEPMAIQVNLSRPGGVPLPGKNISIKYGEKTAYGITNNDGNASFAITARESYGLVQAFFESDGSFASAKAAKRAVLRTKANWDLMVLVTGYFAANVFIFLLIQRYLGKWLD
ncbi:MAG: hypothetical protein J4203_06355 [Candidatus Diapherotrites archaeon]|uniref:Uncharacterized protein n=1 Tax=Candidatus Iainarchaeum sp. TaxID=3101447 RepID=A0A8T4L8C0_9ARCH|nr:hypothetical protein [Candidatus Diapherotrites archaeon]